MSIEALTFYSIKISSVRLLLNTKYCLSMCQYNSNVFFKKDNSTSSFKTCLKDIRGSCFTFSSSYMDSFLVKVRSIVGPSLYPLTKAVETCTKDFKFLH